MLSPFECLCGNFILPEPASYVFFYALFNLRKLLYIIITNDMQRGAAEKIGGFMESVTAKPEPEPPDPPEESRCKVIPFEKVV